MVTHRTYCRHCTSLCGVVVEVEDNQIVSLKGDREHPLSRGYSCMMGQHSIHAYDPARRLTGPLKRDADGAFTPVGYGEALDDVAGRLRALLDRHGPRSVALYYGTGAAYHGLAYGMSEAFLKAIGSPELYTSQTVDQSAWNICMGRMGIFATGKPFYVDLDAIMLVGNNYAVSHQGWPKSPFPHSNPLHHLAEARRNGTKLIVVDPRRTETAKRADLHLQVKPGEDATLVAAMIRLILERGWQDQAFCDRFVTSIDTLRDTVADFTLDYAAERSGVPAELIEEAARLFATAGRANASTATGPSFSPNSNTAEHLVEALNALCGGYKRAGDRLRTRGGITDVVGDVEGVIPPSRSWEGGERLRTVDAGRLDQNQFPSSRLPDEILSTSEDRVRALIVCGGNPATSIADTRRVVEAFKSLELLVVLDPRLSPTGQLAHYVLPTKLPFERQDVAISLGLAAATNLVYCSDPVVQPPAEVMDDWEVYWELAQRLGVQLTLKAGTLLPGEGASRGYDLPMDSKPTDEDVWRGMCGLTKVPFDELRGRPGFHMLDEPEQLVKPAGSDDGARLHICPPDVRKEIRAIRAESPTRSDDFPYLLISRRMRRVMNTAFLTFDRVIDQFDGPPVFISPEDLAALGAKDGEAIRIASPNGEVFACARADDTLPPGVVSMPMSWGRIDMENPASALVNHLTSLDDKLEPINFMPRQSAIPVALHRTNARPWAVTASPTDYQPAPA